MSEKFNYSKLPTVYADGKQSDKKASHVADFGVDEGFEEDDEVTLVFAKKLHFEN